MQIPLGGVDEQGPAGVSRLADIHALQVLGPKTRTALLCGQGAGQQARQMHASLGATVNG